MFFATATPAPGLKVAFTDRLDGSSNPPFDSFNLGKTDLDDPDDVLANFDELRQALGVRHIVTVNQQHTADVLIVNRRFLNSWGIGAEVGDAIEGQSRLPIADALVTNERNVALAVRVADCVPVLLADPEHRVIAAAHAGRVGLLAGVLEVTVAQMRNLGAREISAWVGPHICPACYEVPEQMARKAWELIPETEATSAKGTTAIDLGAGAQAVLESLGCGVEMLDACTCETPSLYSYRRDGDLTGRSVGVISQ
ncbi:MAG: peptidoglycan editing factor PgeF [Propionibacteriaceae bacterium]|jgi:YfiH family protein|nr:peptidoglycan editing factor PgeF [Propionibacteriaceae bacterium]